MKLNEWAAEHPWLFGAAVALGTFILRLGLIVAGDSTLTMPDLFVRFASSVLVGVVAGVLIRNFGKSSRRKT